MVRGTQGVNVNSVNGRGETALHVSVINKDLFEVRNTVHGELFDGTHDAEACLPQVSAYLLSQGADTTVTTPMGDNALELAQRHHNTEIALLISRHSRQSLRPVRHLFGLHAVVRVGCCCSVLCSCRVV